MSEGFHEVADVALLRVAAMPASWLERLRAPRTSRCLDALVEATARRDAALDRLAAAAFAAVRGLDDVALRRRLLALQRDAHNRRVQRIAAVGPDLPEAVASAAREAQAACDEVRALEADARDAFDDESRAIVEAARRLAAVEAMRDAVDSAANDLGGELSRLAEGRLSGKRLHQTVNTLALYLGRAAAKTSPLGRLAVVAPASIEEGEPGDGDACRWLGAPIRRVATLNIAWIGLASELSHRAGEAPLELTAHAIAGDGSVVFVRRDERTREDLPRLQRSEEHVVRVRGIRPLLEILRAEGRALPAPRAELAAALARAGISGGEAAMARLEAAGLLIPSPPLPMQRWNEPAQVASALAARGPVSARLGAALHAAADWLSGCAELPPAERRERALRIQGGLRAAADAAGGASMPTPSPCLFEDTVTAGVGAALSRAHLGPALSDLACVLSVAASASLGHARRRTLAERLRRAFGDRPVPLLEAAMVLLREDAAPRAEGAKDDPNPLRLEDVDAFLRARRALTERLRALSHRDADGDIQIDPAALAGAWRSVWDGPARRAFVSAMVQIDGRDAGGTLVLNAALQGGGKLFSRFLGSADPEGRVAAALRRHLERLAPAKVVEVSAVQGFNANLHPSIAPFAADYPGTPSVPSSWPRVAFDKLYLGTEGTPAQPVLYEGADGPKVELLDLGFLNDLRSPPLRRLLLALAVQEIPDLSLLRARLTQTATPGVALRPRVSVGRLVVARRAHIVDLAALPELDDPFEQLAALRRLSRAAQIPEVAYARAIAAPEAAPAPSDDGARATGPAFEHKPMWLDFSSPVYARLLSRLRRPGARAIELAEALPRPDLAGLSVDGERRAAEWVIEVLVGEERWS